MATREELGWAPMVPGPRQTFGEFDRQVNIEPGHPRTEQYGLAAMKIRYLLHGAKGTTQFLWSTGVVPERIMKHVDPSTWRHPSTLAPYDSPEWMITEPMGYDLGAHADEPSEYRTFEDTMTCEYRPNGVCYYDGSGLQAEEVLKDFMLEGEGAVWHALERCYRMWIEREDDNA